MYSLNRIRKADHNTCRRNADLSSFLSRIRSITFCFLLLSFPIYSFSQSVFGHAKWIGATTNVADSMADRSITLVKTWKADKPIRHATLTICGLGAYEVTINGKKINEDILSPAWSDYTKTVFYNTLDATSLLRKGKNRIAVMLGSAFYIEKGKRYHKLLTAFGPLTLCFKLHVVYADGSKDEVVSDGTWRWHSNAVVYNSIYGGEDYDARLETGQPLHPVVIQPSPAGTPRLQISNPVRIMRRYGVSQRIGTAMVFDMGQNLAGFPQLTLRGKRGQQVRLIVGESLTRDGHVSQKQTGRPYILTYTLKGSRQGETWHPRFTYYGYQYIEIEGAVMAGDKNPHNMPEVDSLASCFISNSAPTTGSFSCSSERWNGTWRIIDNAVRSNWTQVWTDCPHREKLGWLEQDWLNFEGLNYTYDARTMVRQTMRLIADAQHPDGSLPEIAPEYIKFEGTWAPPFQESPEWGGALVALPVLYARMYQDSSLIRQYLPAMRRYVDYLHTRDSCYILNMGLGDWYDYDGNKAGFARNTPVSLVATAHYYEWTRLVGSFIEGNNLYKQRADSIRRAFISTFGIPKSQAGLAIALEMKLYEEGKKQVLLDNLVADIRRHGTRLTTGDVGTRYLFKALLDNGKEALLWQMLDHDDVPGYGAQVNSMKRTTLTEQWNPAFGASKNHFMLGHINNHLIPDVAGIHVWGDSVTINPRMLGTLTWAKGSCITAGKHRVSSEWHIDNGVLRLNVTADKYLLDNHYITIDEKNITNLCHEHNLRFSYSMGAE